MDTKYIDIICPACHEKLKIPKEYAGQQGRCNRCGSVITAGAKKRLYQPVQTKFILGIAGGFLLLFLSVLAVRTLKSSPDQASAGSTIADDGTASSHDADDTALEEGAILEYEILDTEIDESPLKTMVKRAIVLKGGTVTRESLTNLMEREFSSIASMSGFRHHEHPTMIGIYVYPTFAHTEWDQQIAYRFENLKYGDKRSGFDEAQLQEYHLEPVVKFGFTEAERKAIWADACKAEFDASKAAEKRYPLPEASPENQYGSTERFQSLLKRNWKLQSDMKDELKEKNEAELIKSYGISREVFDAITLEGYERGWPMPPK